MSILTHTQKEQNQRKNDDKDKKALYKLINSSECGKTIETEETELMQGS